MSLLLDALKKAALDKQKSAEAASASASTSATTAPPAVTDGEANSNAKPYELTLDLEPRPAPVKVTAEPELDAVTFESMQESAIRVSNKAAELPVTELSRLELPELATDITPPRSEIRHEAAHYKSGQYESLNSERKSATPAKVISPPPVIIAEPPAPTAPPPETSKPSADKLTTVALVAQQAAVKQATAKQRDALDLLINKSRQSAASVHC